MEATKRPKLTVRELLAILADCDPDATVDLSLPAGFTAKALLLNEMLAQGVTPSELARRMGTSPQVVNRIVDLGHATKIDTIADALRALGARLDLTVNRAA